MAVFTIVKGPGRFDLATGYLRANVADLLRFELEGNREQLDVTIDIQELIPVDNHRSVWRFKGVAMETSDFKGLLPRILKGEEVEWYMVKGRYYLNYDRGVQHGSLEIQGTVKCAASKVE